MCFYAFVLGSCFSVEDDQIVTAAESYPACVGGERSSHGCKLYFVFLGVEVDPGHLCVVQDAVDHLRFI